MQNDEGRIDLNMALTRPGVQSALRSKNAMLHVLVPGLATRDGNGFALSHNPLFQIAGTGANERVLGVEADAVGGAVDMRHNYYGFETVTHAVTSGQFDDTPGSLDFIDGETGGQFGETELAYVRLAWDTGGAAWDVGAVDEFGLTSPEANALRDAFIDSLGDQILRADGHDIGTVEKLLDPKDVLDDHELHVRFELVWPSRPPLGQCLGLAS